jgi:hypothetical protein
MRTLNPEISSILLDGTRDERVFTCEIAPEYFAVYYFPEFFHYPMAPFHFDMWDDYKAMMRGELDDVMDIMFRESAKTSLTKIMLTHAICYKKRKYINWDSYDGANAEQALFDVTIWLQTNQRLIADFGQLYNEPRGDIKTKKRVSDFITTNGVRVEAHTTQESIRGRVFNDQRPDWIIFDDIETNVTKDSPAVTEKIIAHVDEAHTGMAPNGVRSYLCNYITDIGVVEHIKNKLVKEPKAVVRNVPVEKDGKLAWPGKYAFTDQEAHERTTDPQRPIVSLEAKRRIVDNYSAEFLNDPTNAEDAYFNRQKVERALMLASQASEINAGLHIWEQFKPGHRYAIGADTSEGIGQDSNTTVIVDFSAGEIVGTYANDRIPPDLFGDEIARQGALYGKPLVAPEKNNTGFATVTRLLQVYPSAQVFVKRDDTKIDNKRGNRYGWETTRYTKPEILAQFKRAFEDGAIKIYDRRLLEEMRVFTIQHTTLSTASTTKHFDLLMAACIAWAMREFAQVTSEDIDWDAMADMEDAKDRNMTI